jgi:hypothetical protein
MSETVTSSATSSASSAPGASGVDAEPAVPGGVVHDLPDDLRAAVLGGDRGEGDDGSPSVARSVLDLWADITPLAPQRVHLLGGRRQAGEDPRPPDPADL